MHLIVQLITIVYLFLLLPFFFGILEACLFRKKKTGISELLTTGYLLMMAVFWCISVVAVQKSLTLTELAYSWLGIAILVTAAALLCGRKRVADFFAVVCGFLKDKTKKLAFLGILFVSVVVSVCFTRPHYEEMTLEIVTLAVDTDEMYRYDPYTGAYVEQVPAEHAVSPLEMLYAAGVRIAGGEAVVILYYLLPVCLLFYFYTGIWHVGKQLLGKTEYVKAFVLITVGIYWMTTYRMDQSVVTGIFLNSWNGLTWLSCFVMPAAFTFCISRTEKSDMAELLTMSLPEAFFQAVILLLAGQLTNEKGGFYIALMFALTLFVIVGRKGYQYVITSCRFEKRI